LVLISGFSAIAPALYADDTSKLPACCRRLGAHHCAIIAAQLPLGAAVRGVCDQYGFPTVLAPPGCAKAAIHRASHADAFALWNASIAPERSLTLLRISFGRSRQKRGPPVLGA
jgi:hypothetical protein